MQNTLAVQHLNLQEYMLLYVPAIDWLMQCIAYNASEVRGVVLGWARGELLGSGVREVWLGSAY